MSEHVKRAIANILPEGDHDTLVAGATEKYGQEKMTLADTALADYTDQDITALWDASDDVPDTAPDDEAVTALLDQLFSELEETQG